MLLVAESGRKRAQLQSVAVGGGGHRSQRSDDAMQHRSTAKGIDLMSGAPGTILPARPNPTQPDGVLRQSDLPALPTPVRGQAFVYRLLDPVTAEPRYVGRTRTPTIRRHGHRTRKRNSRVANWHRRLALHGLVPVMQILDGPLTYARAAEREEAWRRAHVEAGWELLNAVPCIDGRHEGDTIWTLDAARDAVRALATRLRFGDSYPTRRQFAENGLSGLDTAIERRLGGHRAMAAELGLVMPTPEWTVQAAERAVRRLVASRGLTRYPAKGVRRRRTRRSLPRHHHPLRRPQGLRTATRPRQPAERVDMRQGRRRHRRPRCRARERCAVSDRPRDALLRTVRARLRRTPLRRQSRASRATRSSPAPALGPEDCRRGSVRPRRAALS
jgi:hypothetical protein